VTEKTAIFVSTFNYLWGMLPYEAPHVLFAICGKGLISGIPAEIWQKSATLSSLSHRCSR
jgi:hypothetical protein